MSGRKVFTAGEVLQAADVNDYLMDQSVMVFAGTAARGSAIPSPTEGMVTYRSDDDVVEVYDGSVFKAVGPDKILQVVSTSKTDTFTSTSTSFVTVTGLSASITPSTATSKVLVIAQIAWGLSSANASVGQFKVTRGGTDIYVGDSASNRTQAVFGGFNGSALRELLLSGSIVHLDSPATTSATTYQVEAKLGAAGTLYVNRSSFDDDVANYVRGASSITVMEVSA